MSAINVRRGLSSLHYGIDIFCLISALALAGCGFGARSDSSPAGPTSYPGVALHGTIHGGPSPVVGATVKLYATGSSAPGTSSDGYGIGTFLAEAEQQGSSPGQDTNSNGGFEFNYGSYTCPAKQFVYVVASGGNPGAGINPAAVLVAAVGRCEDLTASTGIAMNELSTIAAAYALGHFTSVTCGGVACTSSNLSAGSIAVGIGAPVTANSQMYTVGGYSAGCISNSFYGTTSCPVTSTAALYHAFLNAANLMTVLTYQPNANTAIVSPGTTVSPPVVNNRLLNSLGNALVACVNSTGATSTACTTVFGATTIGGIAPTNTFQAMINLAQNPTLAGSGYTPTQLLNAATPATSVYSPTLTSPYSNLQDLELTILYPGEASVSGNNGLGYTGSGAGQFQGLYDAFSVGTDINDDVYVGIQTGTSGSTIGNLASFSSSGTLQSYTPNNTTNAVQVGIPSPDGMGNIYTCAVSSSYSVAQWTVSTAGVLGSSTPTTVGIGGSCEGLAVDRQGTVWVSNNQPTATYNLYKLVPPLTTSTTCTSAAGCSGVLNVNSLTGVTSGSYPLGVAVDPNQNIWFADYLSSGVGEVSVLPNSGSLSAPAYAASAISVAAGGEQSYDIAFAPSGTSYVAWVDNNYLSSTASANSGVTEITPSFASSPSTQISGLTKTTYLQTVNDAQGTLVGLNSMAADGAGNIFSDNQNGSQIMETTAAGTNIGLFPCVLKSTGTGCTSSVPTSPRGIAVDSTGSVWVASGTQGMIQIIGLAAPTWPQLSLGKVGKP